MPEINRRSLPRRAAKRKPEGEPRSNEDAKKQRVDDADDGETPTAYNPLSFRWIDKGEDLPNGHTQHSLLKITVEGKTSIVAVGDTVLLRSGDEEDREKAFVAKVESMWQASTKKNAPREYGMKIRARWYFKKIDVQQLKGNFGGPLTKQHLLSTLTNRDLLLSNQYDENDVLTVLDKCIVVNQRPDEQTPHPDSMPPGVFVSRYSIKFGEAPGTAVLIPYAGENQPWPDDMAVEADRCIAIEDENEKSPESDPDGRQFELAAREADNDRPVRRRRSSSRESFFGDADTDGTSEDTNSETSEVPLSEGTNTKGRIQIGPDHQANLDDFYVGQPIVSRNPQLVWLKEAGSAVNMEQYLEESGDILHEYLLQKGLLTQDPSFPLPVEQMEEFLKKQRLTSMTLSNLSTGSSLTACSNKLTRECKLDRLIELLHTKQYNVGEALKTIKSAPQDYVTAWTTSERDLFDSGFRRYSGSLRMIAANSLVLKDFKDVVDFHYRFMIPSQFRRYQDKKREHAVRMMEVIENRRSEGSSGAPRDDARHRAPSNVPNGKTDWSKTPVADVVRVVDERRSSAKDLLFDIQQTLGTEKLKQICRAVKSLHNKSIKDLKDCAEETLHGHPSLLDRFLDYLPKRYKC